MSSSDDHVSCVFKAAAHVVELWKHLRVVLIDHTSVQCGEEVNELPGGGFNSAGVEIVDEGLKRCGSHGRVELVKTPPVLRGYVNFKCKNASP